MPTSKIEYSFSKMGGEKRTATKESEIHHARNPGKTPRGIKLTETPKGE